MAYKLAYTQRAIKDISKLSSENKQRIKKALEKYVENPFIYATKMADPSLGMYRFRVGSYRILFDIEDNDIVVLRIGSRDGIYKK